MAIHFKANLTTLVADLSDGGFGVREVKAVHSSKGHSVELELSNGATVCCDTETNHLWAEGPQNRSSKVEGFLRNLYEGPKSTRWLARKYSRCGLFLAKMNETSALWLLRSESPSARTIRQVISGLPRSPIKLRRSEPLAVN